MGPNCMEGTDENSSRPFEVNLIDSQPHFQDFSDDSEVENNHDGYQPLHMTGNLQEYVHLNDDIDDSQAPEQIETSNMPPDIDEEIEAQVWNEPRPIELEITLDNDKKKEIMNAMAQIKLPNSAIPEWAQNIPEEKWKEDLLERIRQRKNNE